MARSNQVGVVGSVGVYNIKAHTAYDIIMYLDNILGPYLYHAAYILISIWALRGY